MWQEEKSSWDSSSQIRRIDIFNVQVIEQYVNLQDLPSAIRNEIKQTRSMSQKKSNFQSTKDLELTVKPSPRCNINNNNQHNATDEIIYVDWNPF